MRLLLHYPIVLAVKEKEGKCSGSSLASEAKILLLIGGLAPQMILIDNAMRVVSVSVPMLYWVSSDSTLVNWDRDALLQK